MLATTKAELVLVEPGAPASAAQALRATEQNHVLLLGEGESLSGSFDARVRRRVQAMRRASQELCQVTYLVGNPPDADWSMRQRLLAELTRELAPEGGLAVFATASDSCAVLACMGELQLSASAGLQFRAIFSADAGQPSQAAQPEARRHEDVEERSGVRHAIPRNEPVPLRATGS